MNDQSIELGEKRIDDLSPWEIELELVEGENTFTVKAGGRRRPGKRAVRGHGYL